MATASDDMTESAIFFTNARNQKLRRWNLEPPEDIRAVLIIVHGVAEHIKCYESVAESLKSLYNIHACGYDQVGHGMSDGARVDITDFQHYVDDLIIFTELIKNEYPGKRIFIMGHSMGGLVLCQTLLRLPDLCKGCIMYSAAIEANPKVITPFKVAMAKVLAVVLPSFPVGHLKEEDLARDPVEVQKLKGDPLRYQGGMKARWGSNTLKALVDLSSRMGDICLPTLIIHGDSDLVCHINGSQKFYDTITAEDKEFKIYEGCYHRVHTEPEGNAEKFVRDVGDWISNRSNTT